MVGFQVLTLVSTSWATHACPRMTQKALRALVWELSGNESVCSAADTGLIEALPFPWRRKWQPIPVLLS